VKLLERFRTHKAVRSLTLALTVLAAIVAVAIVVSITVDLGPLAKPYAEKYGSRFIERGLHLGSLQIRLYSGRIVIQDLIIDGVHPGDRPFFSAKRLSFQLDWTPAFAWRPDFTISSVELTDWAMLVEKWPNQHNFPRIRRGDSNNGPRRFKVTMRSFRGERGQFAYEDHEAPWSILCRNIAIDIANTPHYHGTATFTEGRVAIQDYVPMWARMKAQFVLDGPLIRLDRIDLDTDGASTLAQGVVDVSRWPEQTYEVQSRVQFQRMREIFFRTEPWPLTGAGDFVGTFHLFKDGRDLAGNFTSDVLGVYEYRFPQLYGSLHWTPRLFEVYDAGARFYGGDAAFAYSIKPLGVKVRPTARFEFETAGTDLQQLTDFEQLAGQRFAGTAVWRNVLEWPLGRFRDHRGEGRIVVSPPANAAILSASAFEGRQARGNDASDDEWGPFAPPPLPTHLPMAGEVTYRFGPDDVTLEGGRFATAATHVTFDGTTAYGDRSHIAFHVLSTDWQESDQLLAGIMTDFGSKTGPVTFGGRGEFDGLMVGAFRRPRVEGDFTGQDLRGFDALWGDATGHVVVQNSYVTVKDAVVRSGPSEIRVDGQFSLGYPREDGGEEIDARFRVTSRDIDSLRHVFQIDDYPVTGRLSGEFHLTGEYERPFGFGGMTIDQGIAYGEPFEKATASLRFDGTGVRLDSIRLAKGSGAVNGAAYVGWDATYSFNADGLRVPMETVAFVQYPGAELTGTAEFTATGNGTFDAPRNDIRFRITDLFAAQEPVGQVTGTLAMRGTELRGEIDAASPRLALTGTGRIALTPQRDAEITFRFHDTSLDPYVRLFEPRLSPYTTAVVGGSVRLVGELTNADRLMVDATVDTVDLRLFDYAIRNATPLRLTLDRGEIKVQDLQLVGDDTRLRILGSIDLDHQRIGLQAVGDANLGILQGFFRDVRGSGHATLTAGINGPLKQPVFSGSATIADGRIRHFSLPNALDDINGTLQFDSGGIRLDDVAATLGGGRVQFGGRIGFSGYLPSELNVTARGENMNLRVPEGIRSLVDANLSLTGSYQSPTLGGTVTVKNAVWSRRIDTPGSIFDLASRRAGGAPVPGPEPAPTFPLKFDIRLLVPSTLRVENNMARMVANAELTLRGTYDKPVVFGHADIERGEVIFEGRRYRITRGSMDFTNPNRIEPFFDVEAETNVRVPGQTYRVIIGLAGTSEQLRPAVSSDPPLPTADVLALLFSDVAAAARGTTTSTVAPEIRARLDPTQTQTDILTARATQALATPISAEVGRVVEQTFGVNTFQLTPSFIDPYSTQSGRINPTARVTIGKRISDRVYLTFSRSLNTTTNDQIVLLEIDQSDLVSWVLSRNEDSQTYALEFRVRRVF
jgi:translocation-and-assembly-module (TAM) inner membrane subunit TamB-like protein